MQFTRWLKTVLHSHRRIRRRKYGGTRAAEVFEEGWDASVEMPMSKGQTGR